jgi:hypothetical protein
VTKSELRECQQANEMAIKGRRIAIERAKHAERMERQTKKERSR